MRKKEIYSKLNGWLHAFGLDFRRYPTPEMRNLVNFLERNSINICIDAGANTGQYAGRLRTSGFRGEIISFEPQARAFEKLQKKTTSDRNWRAYPFALGDKDESGILNISKNSVSSSILAYAPDSLSCRAAPDSSFVGKEEILVKKLDTFLLDEKISGRIFLKMDTQGFEYRVLLGASGSMQHIGALQMELSCAPLYSEEKLFDEMKQFVEAKGFYLASIESGFTDPASGKLLQVEAIFFRESIEI